MRLSRYLTLVVAIVLSIAARGQGFNPTSPGEPNPTYALKVKADPEEAATVTGAGRYVINKNVTVSATATSTEWKFIKWTNSAGTEVSTSSSFTYKTTNNDETFTAHYVKVNTSTLTTQSYPSNVFKATTNTYKEGASVNVSCSTSSGYTFKNWTNSKGEVVSTDRSFYYTVTASDEVLTANYAFTPSSPSEPSETKAKHRVWFTSDPTSVNSFSQTSGMQVTEGNTFSVTAYNRNNYTFENWTINGNVVSTSSTYSGKMGTEDITLVANYVFIPSSPSEPSSDKRKHYSLYANMLDIYKGETQLYPISLENSTAAKSLTFSMTLPEGFTADVTKIQTTSRTSAFTVTGTLSGQTLTVSLTGGTQIAGDNGPVVLIPIKALSTLADGTYDIDFTSATLTLSDATMPTVTFRRGTINVSTLEEGEIQAQFSSDSYMNRVQFTNQSSADSRTYLWDFGDGTTSTEKNPMHIYSAAGTYTVRLTAKGIVKESVAEQVININASSTWKASGDYTLDSEGMGARNFTSLHEAIDLLSQCTPDGNIVITVSNNGAYAMNATAADSIALINTLATKLASGNYSLKALTPNPSTITSSLNFTTSAEPYSYNKVMSLAMLMTLDNVSLKLNNVEINPSALQNIENEELCAETATKVVNLTALSSSSKVTVEWQATISGSTKLGGYANSGTGNIPSMTITNGAQAAQTLSYVCTYKLDGVDLYTYTHSITVRPLMSRQTITYGSVADNATVNFGSVTLSWTNLNTMATEGYTLKVQRTDISTAAVTYHLTSNSRTIDCAPGATYTWQVIAHGACDDLTGPVYTFTTKQQANLTVTAIEAPEDAEALTSFTVKATIKNTGKGTTIRTSWTDAIYRSTTADGIASATQVDTKTHSGALAPDGSYEVTFTVSVPDATVGLVYYYVKTDYNNSETETDETDNVMVSNVVEIANRYVDSEDYAVLKAFFNATNGNGWEKQWHVGSRAINSTAWTGVTFNDEGKVTAINLANNNVRGTLGSEAFTLTELKTLNLSGNLLTGDLSKAFGACTKLTSLNVSYNRFDAIATPIPSTVTTLNMENQNNDRDLSYFTKQEWELKENVDNVELSSLFTYNHKDQKFNAHPQLYLYSVGNTYLGSMQYSNGSYKLSLSGDYKLENKSEIVVRSHEGVASGTRLRGSFSWFSGDANVDGIVNVLDAQHTLNRVLGRQSGNFNFSAANTYSSDEIINVQDIVATINIFIGEESGNNGKSMAAKGDLSYSSLHIANGAMYLDTYKPVAALDFTLRGVTASQISLQLNRNRYQMFTSENNDGLRVVIISPAGDAIPEGSNHILKISGDAEVKAATASDIDAKPIDIRADFTTGIDNYELQIPNYQAPNTYDLTGRRVKSGSQRGLYIQNGRKVIIK